MSDWIVLSHHQAMLLLRARQAREESVLVSLDLGLTTAEVSLEQERVVFSAGAWLLCWVTAAIGA